MIRYLFKTVQGRIVCMFVVFMTLVFVISTYTIRYASQNAMEREKEAKLLSVAVYQDKLLGEESYDSILEAAGALGAAREEKIYVLNRALAERTEEVASLFPSLGTGYYSLDLDAMLTYGPSSEYGDRVGLSIDMDHPGRAVMSENRGTVQVGSMVRGHIMNAMHPISRDGKVIGYAWANELTSEIEKEYRAVSNNTLLFITVFYIAALVISILLSRRMMRDIDTVIAGVKKMNSDLTARIEGVGGEFGEVADNINCMAENIEKNVVEHDALLKAEAANAAQRDFLSRMSHEMRTPMNAVIGMTGIARQTNDIGKIHGHLDKINGAANHLLGVINDVLDISKIEAGKLELSETSFSFRNMLDQVASVIQFKIGEKRQNFSIEPDKDVPEYIFADRQRLAQVIANLLSNANKFTPEGGNILLRAGCLGACGASCRLRLEVRDDGIGISPENQDRLFHPFEQGDNGISRKYGGTGLGLAISRRIVEMMNGRIWIESELGHGAAFIVEIEAGIGAADDSEADIAQSETPEDAVYAALSGKCILLAEDMEINREIVLAMLEPTGLEIYCAVNGLEAVRIFSESPEKYSLIFMDVQMPEMDGYEATRQIRSMDAANAKTVPIIAMTANVFKEDIDKCLESGMNSHIGKPFRHDDVMNILRTQIK